jgi:hypothetical protein
MKAPSIKKNIKKPATTATSVTTDQPLLSPFCTYLTDTEGDPSKLSLRFVNTYSLNGIYVHCTDSKQHITLNFSSMHFRIYDCGSEKEKAFYEWVKTEGNAAKLFDNLFNRLMDNAMWETFVRNFTGDAQLVGVSGACVAFNILEKQFASSGIVRGVAMEKQAGAYAMRFNHATIPLSTDRAKIVKKHVVEKLINEGHRISYKIAELKEQQQALEAECDQNGKDVKTLGYFVQ